MLSFKGHHWKTKKQANEREKYLKILYAISNLYLGYTKILTIQQEKDYPILMGNGIE